MHDMNENHAGSGSDRLGKKWESLIGFAAAPLLLFMCVGAGSSVHEELAVEQPIRTRASQRHLGELTFAKAKISRISPFPPPLPSPFGG